MLSTVVVPFLSSYPPLSILGGAPQSMNLQEGALPDHLPPNPQESICKKCSISIMDKNETFKVKITF